MRTFLRQHPRAFVRIFVYTLIAYFALRSVQFVYPGSLPWMTGPQVLMSMPVSWVLGSLLDPMLWKLPIVANIALFEVILAAGFAANTVALTLFFWHRKATGRWWGSASPAR